MIERIVRILGELGVKRHQSILMPNIHVVVDSPVAFTNLKREIDFQEYTTKHTTLKNLHHSTDKNNRQSESCCASNEAQYQNSFPPINKLLQSFKCTASRLYQRKTKYHDTADKLHRHRDDRKESFFLCITAPYKHSSRSAYTTGVWPREDYEQRGELQIYRHYLARRMEESLQEILEQNARPERHSETINRIKKCLNEMRRGLKNVRPDKVEKMLKNILATQTLNAYDE